MSLSVESLYALLPAIYRIRDQEQGEPLKQFLSVVAEQAALIEEDIEQLYDDLFIETCAEWVVPYIGDLIGYRPLSGSVPGVATPRWDVADTIRQRRRKGTAAMLADLARAVTQWPGASAVEYFSLLATTQHMNHVRQAHRVTPDLREWEPLVRLGTAFDSVPRTVDVRRIATGRGRYNIPNIGIFLWRLQSARVTDAPAFRVGGPDGRRFRFSVLGQDLQLFNAPLPASGDGTGPTTARNVPAPLGRRELHEDLARHDSEEPAHHYGPGRALSIRLDGEPLPAEQMRVCNLAGDDDDGWAHQPPAGVVAVDPELGRLAFPENEPAPTEVLVSYRYGLAAEIGGGAYDRLASFASAEESPGQATLCVAASADEPDCDHQDIQSALDALPPAGGIIEIRDSRVYAQALSINLSPNATLELRAANGQRPTLMLPPEADGDLAPVLSIRGAARAITLNGLLIAAPPQLPDEPGPLVQVGAGAGNALEALTLSHCTLVPGQALGPDGLPRRPLSPALSVELPGVAVTVDRCIVGGVRSHGDSPLTLTDSVLDATAATGTAYAGAPGPDAPPRAGGSFSAQRCTVIGKVFATELLLVSDSIIDAELADADDGVWPVPVRAERRQAGCIRFSYVPRMAVGPHRYRCQPDMAIEQAVAGLTDPALQAAATERAEAAVAPRFVSERYGNGSYLRLRHDCAEAIRRGSERESEMGVYHDLYQTQREANLRVRLEEYLRFGLEAGIFYET